MKSRLVGGRASAMPLDAATLVIAALWAVYALAALGLAAVVLRAKVNAMNLGIGLVLVQQAFGTAAGIVVNVHPSEKLLEGAFHSGVYFWILWASVVFMAAPLLLWHTRRWRIALLVGVVGAAGPLALVVLGSADPSLILDASGFGLTTFATAMIYLAFLAFAATVGLLALEAFLTPLPIHRAQFALLAAAFGCEGMFHAAQDASNLVADPGYFFGFADLAIGKVLLVVPFLAFGLVALAAAWVAWRGADADRRKWGRIVLAFLVVTAISGILAPQPAPGEEFSSWSGAFHAVWDLASLCLVVFAALRFQLFDVELKAKSTIVSSLAVLALVALFIGVENVCQGFVADRYLGWLPGDSSLASSAISGGVVAAAFLPVYSASKKVGHKLLPGVVASDDYEHKRKEEIYGVALEGALMDGIMSPREMKSLQLLRQSLGLTDADHERLEAKLRGLLAAPAPAAAPMAA